MQTKYTSPTLYSYVIFKKIRDVIRDINCSQSHSNNGQPLYTIKGYSTRANKRYSLMYT